MSKNKLLVLIFILLAVSYSCIKKSKALRPDVTHDLSMSIDYYGSPTPPPSMRPIVEVSYTKHVTTVVDESDLVPVVFSDEKLLEGVIQIPEKAEVTITLRPTDANHYTLMSYLGDDEVPNDFDILAREYTFTMDTNKKFEVILSTTSLRIMDFVFEVVGNGTVEISSTKTGDATQNYIATAVSKTTIQVKESDFDAGLYTIVAEAKPSIYNKFDEWSGKGSGTATTLPINNANMEGTITATFVVIPPWNGASVAPIETDGEWIILSEPGHLSWLADRVNNNRPGGYDSKKYKFKNDIDYTRTDGTKGLHTPIGGGNWLPFTGVIDGAGFSIKNAHYGRMDYAYTGFVGLMSGNGTTTGIIRNLTIDSSVVINGSTRYVGAIVGSLNNGMIYNCVNKANISVFGDSSTIPPDIQVVGGIVGGNTHTLSIISNVYNLGNISVNSSIISKSYIGGIVGENVRSSLHLINTYNTGNIHYNGNYTKPSRMSGLVGFISGNETISFINVYSTASITTTLYMHSGGLIAETEDTPTINLVNAYFLKGSSILSSHGFYSSDVNIVSGDRYIESTTWTVIHNAFNSSTEGKNAWKTGPDNRPVIVGLPAE